MIKLQSFTEVCVTVAQHVEETGHQNLRVTDDPPSQSTGYSCHDCQDFPTKTWLAPTSTIHDLPPSMRIECETTSRRAQFVCRIVKKALEPKPYRPTSWERVVR